MAWWDGLDFNLGGSGFDVPALDFQNFNLEMPAFDPQWFQVPDFNLGFDPSFFSFDFDPLALPTLPAIPTFDQFSLGPTGGMQPDFAQFGIPDKDMQGIGGPPMALSDMGLGFGGANAPDLAPPPERMFAGSDPIPNLMGETPMLPQDSGASPYGSPWMSPNEPGFGLGMTGAGVGLPGSSAYATPGGGMGGGLGEPKTWAERAAQAQVGQIERANQPKSWWDKAATLTGAFGPLALGAAGMGLQMANRPERNPLEDELMRARIDSSKQQDALAKERLDFEREHAARALEAQAAMQAAMLEARKPGGQANINALLQGNPQLAALYQALTSSGTGLASGSGSPEFQAVIDQIAQVDIAELRRQADEQKAQALEMANRQGVNPANIIAKIEQTFLQEAAKAKANARSVLMQQMQPGISTFNSVGGLFGNLFQVPGA